jgi:hypothetical protein
MRNCERPTQAHGEHNKATGDNIGPLVIKHEGWGKEQAAAKAADKK